MLRLQGVALIFVLLLTTLPVAFAVSVNPSSIVVDVTDSTATIAWETDTAAIGAVNYGTSTSSLQQAASTAGEATEHAVMLSNLESAMYYYYTIEATDDEGTYKTNYMNFTTLLEAPENLAAVASENTVELSWNEVDDARLYYIFQNGIYFDSASTESYPVEDLDYQTTYEFTVIAVDRYGRQSAPSNAVEVTTEEEPVEISFVQITDITKTTAKISWKTETETNATVWYGTVKNNLNMSTTDAEKTTEHELILKDLEEETTYYYLVGSTGTQAEEVDYFKTVGDETAIEILSVEVEDITRESAELVWTTNIETRGYIYYSTDDSFSQSVREDTEALTHIETLRDLLSGTTYYFKIVAEDMESDIANFTTSETLYDFIDMEEVPSLWNDETLLLKGTTAENGKVYIFVNKDSNPYAQVMMDINGTSFEANITLNPYAYVDGIKGRNIIEIHSWDQENNKALKTFTVDLDTAAPRLSVNEFATYLNEEDLNISGTTDQNVTVTFLIDEKKKAALYVTEEDGSFEQVINVGTATTNHTVTVEAMDAAGNAATYEKLIYVDRQNPAITFFTSFTDTTHYKLFRIDGETEPGASITVTNFGEFSGCDDPVFQTKYGECDYLANVYGPGPYQSLEALADPTSIMFDLLDLPMGVFTSTIADDDGNFSVIVSLLPGEVNQQMLGKNTLVFNVTDLAGNKYDTKKQIKYQSSCLDWSLTKTTSFPINIYTQDLRAGDILGSTVFEVRYIGAGTPDIGKITVQEDDSAGKLIKEGVLELGTAESVYYAQSYGGLENSNEYISLSSQDVKSTEYDEDAERFYLYTPITINKYAGNVEDLPEQFGIYLDAYISYTDGTGQVASCHLYPAVSYDVQKPESISRWLSPTMINETIAFLDQTINVTESAVKYATIAARWTLVGCGAVIAWNYAKGFSGGNFIESDSGKQCNQDLQQIYRVCDRILCPPIPSSCEDFKAKGDYVIGDKKCTDTQKKCEDQYKQKWEKNEGIRKALDSEYKSFKEHQKDATFADFYEKTAINNPETLQKDTLGTYDGSLSKPSEYGMKNPETGEQITVQYLNLNDPVGAGGDPAKDVYKQWIADCGPNVQSIVRVTGLKEDEGTDINLLALGKKVSSVKGVDYYCSEVPKEEIDHPEKNLVPGLCWSDECPQFDNTKCLIGKGYDMNPAEGLFASLQCGCLPGIKGHLENLLKILKGAKKCFQQVQLGDQTAGYCERLMSYFVCDILTEIFKHLFRSLEQGVGPLAALYGPDRVANYQENAQSIEKGLKDRYGDIVKQKAGFAVDNLLNKACVAAFTADWSVLEGVLDSIVDEIYVEPIATLSATSRPYGFDPFTGRITIAYNVYVGIFPGGPTDIEVWLECDPEWPGGDLCAAGDTSKIDLVQKGKVLPYMDEDDSFDENIVIFDENAMSLFNKATMILEYEVGGEEDKKVYEAQIISKGDIQALGCSFSPISGIDCSLGVKFMDITQGEGGSVELYSTSQGTTLSPDIDTYYGTNQVAALVKLKNNYAEDFFIRVNNDKDEFEYKAQGGTESGNYRGLQYYLLWLDKAGAAATGIASFEDWTSALKIKDFEKNISFSLPENVERATLKLSAIGSGDESFKTVTCKLEKGAADAFTEKGEDGKDTIYYPCLTTDQKFTVVGTEITRSYDDVDYIKAVTFSSVTWEDTEKTKVGDKVTFKIDNGYVSATSEKEFEVKYTTTSATTETSKQKTASVNVLADTNEDGGGETKIYSSDQKPKDQGIKISYTLKGTPSSQNIRPVLQFMEPVAIIESDSGYVNNDQKPVPLGFTLWDDKNDITSLSIGITKNDGWQCLATWTYDEENSEEGKDALSNTAAWETIDGYPCSLEITDRTIGYQDENPPFFEFDLHIDGDKMVVDNDAYYDITLSAVDGDGNAAQDRIKRIRLSESTSAETLKEYHDMLVCLGSGECSSEFTAAETEVESIVTGSAQEKEKEEEEKTTSTDATEEELVGLS